jgi:protein-disulfide isomerase
MRFLAAGTFYAGAAVALILALPAAAQPTQQQPTLEEVIRDFDLAPRHELQTRGFPSKGPEGAPIQVVVYSDFLCPSCRGIAQAFEQWLPTSGGRVAIVYKDYPLDQACNDNVQRNLHPGACWIALAGMCANEQGRFWELHHTVFERQASLKDVSAQDVINLAVEAGLDRQATEACVHSPGMMLRLKDQIAEAARAGVRGTPSLFVNGRPVPRVNFFTVLVEHEARRLGLTAAPVPQ